MESDLGELGRARFRLVGVFANGFALVALQNGGAVYIVDQHAAHERVRLEMLQAMVHDHLQDLKQCNHLDTECINRCRASSDPMWIDRTLRSRACRGAVPVTRSTRVEELVWIITSLAQCRHPTACAHGRPTMVRLSLSQDPS